MLWGTTFAFPEVHQAKTGVFWVLAACDEAEHSDQAKGYCAGFSEGVYNSMKEWCVPEEVTRGELQELIVVELRLLDAKSGEINPARDAITEIISDRWPCTE